MINYTEIIAVRERENKRKKINSPYVVWEYQMVKKFGTEFYEFDEKTAEAFSLIDSIISLYEDIKTKEKK